MFWIFFFPELAEDKELVPEVIVVVADATPRPAGQIPNFQILDETVEEIFEKKSDVLAEDEAWVREREYNN